MKIEKEITPTDFLFHESWCCETLVKLIDENEMREEFDNYIEETFKTSCTETELNDYLRFNEDKIIEDLGFEVTI